MKRFCSIFLLLAILVTSIPCYALAVTAEEINLQGTDTIEVQFDTQGGSSLSSSFVQKGETIEEPENPTKEGFLFGGWYLNDTPFDFTQEITAPITLSAKWIENTIPKATLAYETLQIDPGYLEFWLGMTLQLGLVTTGKVTRSDGYQYTRYFNWDVPCEWHVLDDSVASVDENGNVTAKALGHTYLWAVVKEDTTATFESGSVSVPKGGITIEIEVVVTEPLSYYKKYLEDPENQQITKTSNTQTNTSIFTSKPGDAFGSGNIALWYDDAISAFTMTCDDNLMGDFDEWNTWLETYGIPVTFMAPTSSSYESGDKWLEQISLGHAVQSHSHYHHSSAEYSDNRKSAQGWVDFYYGVLDIESLGIDSLVIGYPCGKNYTEFSKMLYIAGRGGNATLNTINTNYNSICSFSGFPSGTANIEKLKTTPGSWMCVHYHSIGSGSATVEANYALLKEQIDAGTLWATTFAQAAQYGQERDTATLQILSSNQEEGIITFRLTDQMNDELFYQPLTVKITVDSTWTNCSAVQNGIARGTRIVKENGKTYCYVDAVPDAGDVILQKANIQIENGENEISISVPNLGTIMHVDLSCTEAFEYCTVKQGDSILDATYTNTCGACTLSFDLTLNGESCTITPYETSTSDTITMTDLYKKRVEPVKGMVVTISSAEELSYLSAYTNADCLTAGITFSLIEDLDASTLGNFTPIGWFLGREASSSDFYYHPFEGTFLGNGHTISGLEVNRTVCNAGLFGYIDGATIQDVTVKGAIHGMKRCGGIVGYAVRSTLTNLVFEGSVTNVGRDGDRRNGSYTGGIVGQMDTCDMNNCMVENAEILCYAPSKINRKLNTYDGYGKELLGGIGTGGLIGCISYGAKSSTQSKITNSSFSGTVTAFSKTNSVTTKEGGSEVGGLVGTGLGFTISGCSARGTIQGESYVGGLFGKLVGTQSSVIENSSFKGTVQGSTYVGGMVGYLGDNSYVTLRNSFAMVEGLKGDTNVGLACGVINYSGSGKVPTATNLYVTTSLTAYGVANLQNNATITCSITDVGTAFEGLNTWASANHGNSWFYLGDFITPTHTPIYPVTFVGLDDKVLTTVYVGNGLSCSYPEVPTALGYVFDSWDQEVSCVTGPMTVHAIYNETPVYTVTFKDADGTILKVQQVNKGDSATAPVTEDPDGYVFDSWKGSYTNVTADVVVQASYVRGYVVSFYGMNGALLEHQKVRVGNDAVAPTIPAIEGYHFVSWSEDFTNIQGAKSIYATYEKNLDTATSIKVLQWYADTSLTGDALADFEAQLQKVDLALVTGVAPFTLNTLASKYAVRGYKTTRGASGGTGYTVVYNTEKYALDTSASVYETALMTWTDLGMIAVPLKDLESGKQIVCSVVYTGSFSKTDASNIKKFANNFFTILETNYPSAECWITAVQMCTPTAKGGCSSKKAYYESTYVEGKSTEVLFTAQESDTFAEYFMVTTKDSLTKTLLTQTDVTGTTLQKAGHIMEFDVKNALQDGKTYYVVSFLNEDGTLIENQYVEEGTDAVPPENIALKEHYELDTWVGDYTNITSNRGIQARSKLHSYEVVFQDKEGNTIKTILCPAGSTCTFPDAPSVEGYEFVSWSVAELPAVYQDYVVTPIYNIRSFTATFLDENGELLSTITKDYGSTIEFPQDVVGENELFVAWTDGVNATTSTNFELLSNVTWSLQVRTTCTVTYYGEDQAVLKNIEVNVGSTLSAYALQVEKGYTFIGWTSDGILLDAETTVRSDLQLYCKIELDDSYLTQAYEEAQNAMTLLERKQAINEMKLAFELWTASEQQEYLKSHPSYDYKSLEENFETLVEGILFDLAIVEGIY